VKCLNGTSFSKTLPDDQQRYVDRRLEQRLISARSMRDFDAALSRTRRTRQQ